MDMTSQATSSSVPTRECSDPIDVPDDNHSMFKSFADVKNSLIQYLEDYASEVNEPYRKIPYSTVTKIEDHTVYFNYKGVQLKVVTVMERDETTKFGEETEMLYICSDHNCWNEMTDIHELNIDAIRGLLEMIFARLDIKTLHPNISVIKLVIEREVTTPYVKFCCGHVDDGSTIYKTNFLYVANGKNIEIEISDENNYKSGLFDGMLYDMYQYCNANRTDVVKMESKIDGVIKYFEEITVYPDVIDDDEDEEE